MTGGAPHRREGDENLAEFLADRARRTSDGGLVAIACVGLPGAIASVLWGGRGWMLPCALALCLVAFSAWGISDRELNERLSSAGTGGFSTLRIARWLAAILGAISALAALFAMLALTLGTWIS